MTSFLGKELTCVRGGRVVFTNLNFSITEGELLYLKGPNGSGKTTLLRLMAGILQPNSGGLTWNGSDIDDDKELFRSSIHYVGHNDAIKMGLTVEENLSFWAEMNFDLKKKGMVKAALKKSFLDNFSTLPARFLSAGQRKRLNLARLYTTYAPLWLLDEPSNSLDSESVKVLSLAISEHRQTGGMVVIATHQDLGIENNILDLSMFADLKVQSRGYNVW